MTAFNWFELARTGRTTSENGNLSFPVEGGNLMSYEDDGTFRQWSGKTTFPIHRGHQNIWTAQKICRDYLDWRTTLP